VTNVTPRPGPATQWIKAADVAAQPGCDGYASDVLDEAASVASGILYRLSGRQFTGTDTVTVRPLCRPVDSDVRGFHGGWGMGGIMSWGMCSGMNSGDNVASHYGHSAPREVDLGAFPVTEVLLVKINGETIPGNEYELQDYRRLVRMLPSLTADPTEMYGWPTAQRLDLPDTEEGTFSVRYTYGMPPPPEGLRAAKALGAAFAKSFSGDTNALPTRITSIARQGLSAAVVDVEDIVSKGLTGIYMVDVFIQAWNPGRSTMKAQVWTPDAGRARRLPRNLT
jgi:hypothetical protein